MSFKSKFIKGCNFIVLSLFFSCSSAPRIHHETPFDDKVKPIKYSIVFIIHGDSDYVYHDTGGNAYRADEETLERATKVALHNPQAEVFIFHQIPKRNSLLFFPVHDGKFFYYRNGKLLLKESYRRNHEQARFVPEAELYNKYKQCKQNNCEEEQSELVRMFLYFGHEIPEIEGSGYDISSLNSKFTVNDLAEGMNHMTQDSKKFDLIVLSTCFSGTPHTIAAIAPYARYIIASPENIHLSYFELQPFENLNIGLHDNDVYAFAKEYAGRAFKSMTSKIQTAVSIAVYNLNAVRDYLYSIKSIYEKNLTLFKDLAPATLERCDCAENQAYLLPGMSDGVDVFYSPPRFGRSKNKQNHSGWECWKVRESDSRTVYKSE